MSKNFSLKVKKLRYYSMYRGCKESEIIFRKFAEKYLMHLNKEELKEYEELISYTDAKLMDWILYNKNVPSFIKNSKIFNMVLDSTYQ